MAEGEGGGEDEGQVNTGIKVVPGLLCFPLLSPHQDTWDDPGKRLQREKQNT